MHTMRPLNRPIFSYLVKRSQISLFIFVEKKGPLKGYMLNGLSVYIHLKTYTHLSQTYATAQFSIGILWTCDSLGFFH